ncbi:MAG TPA: TonB-dependent receptor [Gemmatimonadales bacterium]
MRMVLVLTLAASPTAALAQQRSDSLRDSARLAPIVAITRAGEPADRVPFAVANADTRDWRGRPSLGIDEALSTMPGVLVLNRFNPAQDQTISIRGFGARSAFGVRGLKILLDGIPQTLPDGQGQLTNVDVAEADRVEVLRGSASSLYGNASGGVVSIWTVPRAGAAELTPVGSGVTGSDGLAKWRIGGSAPLGSADLGIDASRTTADGYRLHSHADIRRLRAVLQNSVGDRGDTRVTVAVHGVDEPTAEDPGQLTLTEADTGPRSAAPRNLAVDAGKTVNQWESGVTVEHRGENDAGYTATIFGVRRTLTNPTSATLITLGRWAYGARVTWSPGTGGPVSGTFGADLQWQRDDRQNNNPTTNALTLNQLEQVNEMGYFAEARWRVSSRLLARGVVRFDRTAFAAADRLLTDGDQSGDMSMWSPSFTAGVTAQTSEAFAPYVTTGTSFETPTTTELTNRPDGLGGFNPSLNPQRAWNTEGGARGRLGALTYSAAIFWTEVRDELIPFQVPGGNGRQFFQNAGSARHRGAELGATWRAPADFAVSVAYTLADYHFTTFRTATDTLDGKRLPGIPTHDLYASLRWEHHAFWGAVDETVSSRVFADNDNTVTNPGWAITGARAGWDAWTGRWRLTPFGGVTNLFDKTYIGSIVINAANGRYYEPSPGRSWYVGFKAGG